MTKIDFKQLKKYSVTDSSLRDYQQENKQIIYDAWSRTNSVMLQMPTGTGKTRLFVSIIKDIFQYCRDKGSSAKILIMVHRTELIDQIDHTLNVHYKLEHGIIQAGEKEVKTLPIQLASVQTLSRRLDNWTDKEFDFIIVDEAHHVKAESYQKIIKAFPHSKLLGVTATPVRLDGRGFTDTFEELIVSPNVWSFINNGYLSDYEYYSIPRNSFIQKEINEIKKFSQGDYAESELERVCDNGHIRAQVVNTYLKFAKGKKGIVYTINKAHNYNLALQFNENGISAIAIDSDTPKELRERYIEQFKKGEYKIICNVNLFTEGFDCPDIEFVQLARPTKSLALYLQQVGRGLRISEGKGKALFLDNVGLYNSFGFPSSFRNWAHHFEGKDKNQSEKQEINQCFKETKSRSQDLREGNEVVHLIQTVEEKEKFEHRKSIFKVFFICHAIHISVSLKHRFEKIYIDGLGLKMNTNCYLDGDWETYNDLKVYIKERTRDLKDHMKWEDYLIKTYKDGVLVNCEYRPCQNYDELEEELNKKFQYEREWAYEFKSKYQEFLDENYSEEEIFDIVNDLVQNQEVYENADLADIDEIPLYFSIIDFWRGAHKHYKKKIPKSIDCLMQATEIAIRNTYSGRGYICDTPSRSEEYVPGELTSEKRARRRVLRKWLVDTRRGNSDKAREEHIRKWWENFTEFLTLEGNAAYEDEKIIEAAKHYGIELSQNNTQ